MNDANAERDAESPGPEGEIARSEPGDRDAGAVIEALNAENGQLKDRVLRTLAEMENLRRRTEREVIRRQGLRGVELRPRHADRGRQPVARARASAG